MESVRAVLDLRTEELGRVRKQLELLRLERAGESQEDKETQTSDGGEEELRHISDLRGRSSLSAIMFIVYLVKGFMTIIYLLGLTGRMERTSTSLLVMLVENMKLM